MRKGIDNNFYALVLAVMLIRFVILPLTAPQTELTQLTPKQDEMPAEKITPVSPFAKIHLSAEAALVYDVAEQKVLFTKNANEQLPLASLTKLMTALVAREAGTADHLVTIDMQSLAQEGEQGLVLGETWRLEDILDFTLLTSSNDAAHAIATSFGSAEALVERMNARAKALGLEQTYFLNETGLDIEEDNNISGAYGSASDVAQIMSLLVRQHADILEITREETATISSLSKTYIQSENTNIATNRIPWLIGSKTGFTELAGGNLAVAFDAGLMHPVVVVVLGSTFDERFEDVAKLVATTFEHLES